ncbi:serine/threonine protein kinase [Gigaspora margarita]|uniref:Serine/threonine protein kinase n=1 Tax=Gigaspora margarita TaxID=4874 RepID=A0A8H4AJJ2_GIGMA|nr:serine/threonine protein kinase [Gigaspora margarita]
MLWIRCSIELGDSVCNDLNAPKEEIITTIQVKITNDKLKAPEVISTAKELLDCADNYVVENSTKKVIKDKKRNSVAKVQDSTTPVRCNKAVSNQKNGGSFEISETVCKEIDVPVEKVVNEVKKDTKNEKLKSPESEPWWKTDLTVSYLNVDVPHHKKQWEDKDKKAREYLSDQIKDVAAEKELLDCTDKYVVDKVTKKVEKVHKKDKAITIVQDAASPKKSQEIVSKQKDHGSIELDDSVCNELGAPKEDNNITTIKKKITNEKFKSPEYVIDKVTDKVIKENERDVIELKKDEIPIDEKEKGRGIFGGFYDTGAYVVETINGAFIFNKNKIDDHEKAEALIIVEESATPEKCEEIVSNQKDDGSIELGDTVCNELDASKEEIITTIQKKITNDKLKSPKLISTAVNLSYLKKSCV